MAVAKMQEFATPEFWDVHYTTETKPSYEWLRSYHLEPLFLNYLPSATENEANPKILHLGCGNSTLPMDLIRLGYKNQTCVDFSAVVIEQMASLCKAEPSIEWKIMDVRHMDGIQNEEFEAAIDKGALDSMIWGGRWNLPEQARKNAREYFDDVARVLKPNGVFICITFQQPGFMREFLIRPEVWDFTFEGPHDSGNLLRYFGFVMKKKESIR